MGDLHVKKKVAVIGAGPAGLTAAYQLSKRINDQNISVDVYESSSHIGGLCRTIELWNQKVDLGPHRFFTTDKRISDIWFEVVDSDYTIIHRLTRIYYNNRFFYYPLKPFNALINLGLLNSVKCVFSFIKEKLHPVKQNNTFETWVVSKFGRTLYEIFFKTYSEKLWGIKCSELDADFAAQRIKKFSLSEVIRGFFISNNKKYKTLVEQFAYPNEGTGMLYERMAERIKNNGGNIYVNIAVKEILLLDNQVTGLKLKDGTQKSYDHIISTMPLTLLVNGISDIPENVKNLASSLKFRNTILVYLNIDSDNLFPDQWIYVHSEQIKTGRITNFRNWGNSLYKNEKSSIICLEYWCDFNDEMWVKTDNQLIEIAKEDIFKTRLVNKKDFRDGFVYKIPRCYPVYFSGYKEKLDPVIKHLKTINGLQVIGRYGSYKYNNQDHSMLMGILAAENVLEQKNHDLWEINTDYEDYQEGIDKLNSTGN